MPATTQADPFPDWLEIVRRKVEGLRYGLVQIVVHDGKVTLIERTEKTRLDAPSAGEPTRRERERA